MADYGRMRATMVDTQLRPGSITDRRVLAAMGWVPREIFVPEPRRPVAYIDDSHPFVPVAPDRSLSAPAPFARLIQLAGIGPQDRVLDVGAASGYSSAVLARLGGHVVGLEHDPALAELARANLAQLGIANVEIVEGPHDSPPEGAFDVIVVEGAVDAAPASLFPALAEGGRLVVLIRSGAVSVAHVFVNSGGSVSARAEFNASLPPLEVLAREEEFVF